MSMLFSGGNPGAQVAATATTSAGGAFSATVTLPLGKWKVRALRIQNGTLAGLVQIQLPGGTPVGPSGGATYLAPVDDWGPGPTDTLNGNMAYVVVGSGMDASVSRTIIIALEACQS